MFTWKVKNSQYCFSLRRCLYIEKDRFLFSASFLFPFLGKLKCWCYCLFGRLEARETGVLLDVLLAHSFVLYSSSHSGGLASGAIWLSSTLWRYWYLAIKYCFCKEVKHQQHTDFGKHLLYLATQTHTYVVSLCNGLHLVCVFLHVFQCGSVFDFSIFHLSGWQFKTTKWNISKPFSKLRWHIRGVIVIL